MKQLRDREKTRTEILNVGFWEIYKNGFNGVSVNDIIAKTSVTKGAFFHYFHTKNDLGYAIADEILRDMIIDRWIKPLAAYKNPIQGITTRLKKTIDASSPEELALGCPLNNLIQEMSAVDPIFRAKLLNTLELWISEIEKQLKKAQDEGYLKKSASPRQVAEFVVMTHEGGFGLSKSFRSKKIFISLYNSLKDYLNSVSENQTK
ncbi:MAG: TetR/AcrR family transcriptional regulator [bacterium]|nr:TetR/AcrR family transcriptional regulator [bacterium]